MSDLQRAIRLVRDRADELQIDPQRVGVLGFSAGREFVALSGMRFDAGDSAEEDSVGRQSGRPVFLALIYSGYSRRYEPIAESRGPHG